MPVLLQAAVHVRENKATRAEEILGQYADKFPDSSKVILLARAQVAAAAGHPQIAADSLVKIPDIQHNPATVATIVSLKERAGDADGADAVFDSAIKWWSNDMTEDNKLNTIMQEAASFKLRHGRKEEAGRLYEQLVKSHKGCKLKGFIPGEIGNLTSVIKMDLSQNELTGHIPITFQGMLNIQQLYLQHNKIEGNITDVFCNLKNLGALGLSWRLEMKDLLET